MFAAARALGKPAAHLATRNWSIFCILLDTRSCGSFRKKSDFCAEVSGLPWFRMLWGQKALFRKRNPQPHPHPQLHGFRVRSVRDLEPRSTSSRPLREPVCPRPSKDQWLREGLRGKMLRRRRGAQQRRQPAGRLLCPRTPGLRAPGSDHVH